MVASRVKSVIEAAMQLPPEEREVVIDQLCDSLDPGADDAEQVAWEKELDRRIDEIERGDAHLIDGGPFLKALKEGRIP